MSLPLLSSDCYSTPSDIAEVHLYHFPTKKLHVKHQGLIVCLSWIHFETVPLSLIGGFNPSEKLVKLDIFPK